MPDLDRRSFIAAASITASLVSAPVVDAREPAKVKSISAMTMAPDGRLVLADWRSGSLHVLDLPKPGGSGKTAAFNLVAFDEALAMAGSRRVRATALAWQEHAGRAIVAAEIGGRVLLALATADGSVTIHDPDDWHVQSLALSDLPGEGSLWGKASVRTLTVTCFAWQGNELLISGIANADFASTLRRIAYPFGKQPKSTRIEMYHAVHNQLETRAPIRAMDVVTLGGIPHLLAAYTCTPLVIVPLAELVDQSRLRAKTIAELGFGNTPLSVMSFAIEYQGQSSDWVLVANAAKSADLIALPAIAEAAAGQGLTQPVKAPFDQFAGVRAIPVPLGNLVAVADQGDEFLLALRRDAQTGALELVSFRKGAFFRLSDHVNEYDMPGYAYPEGDSFQQGYIRPFHAMMKRDEGHDELIR